MLKDKLIALAKSSEEYKAKEVIDSICIFLQEEATKGKMETSIHPTDSIWSDIMKNLDQVKKYFKDEGISISVNIIKSIHPEDYNNSSVRIKWGD